MLTLYIIQAIVYKYQMGVRDKVFYIISKEYKLVIKER